MKTLMLSTALASAVAVSAVAQTAMDPATDGGAATVPAFLAGDVIGKSLHTLDSDAASGIGADTAAPGQDRLRWTSSDAFLADRDDWQDVGSIDDIVLTKDGETRGFLVDVGGFLGFGARTVMIDITDVYFVSDGDGAEDVGDFHMVVAMSSEQLEALPEFDDETLRAGFEGRPRGMESDDTWDEAGDAGASGWEDETSDTAMDGSAFDVIEDGFAVLADEDRTADRLIGADVYDAGGENVGTVDDVVLGADDRISEVIVDVGGFLGIGAHTVALPIHDATIVWHDEDDVVRVQVTLSADALEAMPEYEG
ncbi:MAG: PRC-barrel domain-containing protein [Alkalilacustris sp.]